MCLLDDYVSVVDITATFNTVLQQCLDNLKIENINLYTNFDEAPIDTIIYVDKKSRKRPNR